MRMFHLVLIPVIAMFVSAATGAIHPAAAAKAKAHPTYEEAWTLCTAFLDRNHILKVDAGQRYAAGAACMHKYGYRI